MSEPTKIEYRVREVTRYIVTSYREEGHGAASGRGHGEFDNHIVAHEVAHALARAEHERLGWPLNDARIEYPEPPHQGSGEAL